MAIIHLYNCKLFFFVNEMVILHIVAVIPKPATYKIFEKIFICLRGGAPIRTNFPHFLTSLFKSNNFGFYVCKLEEARIFFCEKSYGCHGNGGHLGKYLKFLNR